MCFWAILGNDDSDKMKTGMTFTIGRRRYYDDVSLKINDRKMNIFQEYS